LFPFSVSPNVQNVRTAATPSTVQLATPQITYLTTGPVTFQQIPVLSSQVSSRLKKLRVACLWVPAE